MDWKKILIMGIISGIVFSIVLFIGGAITGRIVYGLQMAPEGKFTEDEMNAFYFIWTKLVIGIFFGILFLVIYEKLPIHKKVNSFYRGTLYGFVFWLIISLWNLSHPLLYDTDAVYNRDQLFWLLYTLWGFLAYGGTVGYLYKRADKKKKLELS